ncbi:MAG: hypothetical protein N2691_00645 [Patescibacteria group bacterium]|nr:hypothetical protein [Patescibacteria group bacterium]
MNKHFRVDYFMLAAGFILCIAAWLRLTDIGEYITFLGDQGRDAIAMKRIITGEDFPGIGPRSSIGQLYLGPFYYYLMAPFLAASGFDPVGPAIGVAVVTLLAMGLAAWRIRKDINPFTALLFLALVTVSYSQLWLSRFSWNPNLLPVFSFAASYLAYKTATSRHPVAAGLLGFSIAAALQLHYLMLLALPAIAGVVLWGAFRERNSKNGLRIYLRNIIIAAATFTLTFAPFIVFDLRNNFLNFRGLIGIFTESQFQSESTYLERLISVLNGFLTHVLQIEVAGAAGWLLFVFLLASVAGTLVRRIKVSPVITIHVITILSFIFMFALIDTSRFMHYYTPVYWSLFLLVAYWVSRIPFRQVAVVAAVVILCGYTFLNMQKYDHTRGPGNFQTRIAESIADDILSLGIEEPYYLISVPLSHTNDHIRYYLELKGKQPLPSESTDPARNIVFLCYEKGENACNVTEDNQYQAVIFGDKKITGIVDNPEVKIFKVVHAR